MNAVQSTVEAHAPVTVRPATAADADAIARCVDAAYRHYIARIGKMPGPMLDDYAQVVRRERVFVAQVDDMPGAIAGVLVLMQTVDGFLLDNIAVHPDHQRRGIGRRLLRLAESEARDSGCAHLALYTHELMTESIDFYRRVGYRETARRTERGYNRVYMRKALP